MKKKIKLFLLLGALILLGALCYWLYVEYYQDIQLYFSPKASRELVLKSVRSHGIRTAIILIALTSVMCAVPSLPTSVVGVLIGLCYGPLIGSVMNLIGNSLGNLLSIYLIHRLNFLDKTNASNRWVRAISQMNHPRIGVMLGYVIPVIPSIVVNYTVNSLNLKARQLLLVVVIGVSPSSILYAFGGDALFKGNHKTAIILVASVALFVLLIGIIYKDRKRRVI